MSAPHGSPGPPEESPSAPRKPWLRWASGCVVLGAVLAVQMFLGFQVLPTAQQAPRQWEHWLTGGFYAYPMPFWSHWLLLAAGCGVAMILVATSRGRQGLRLVGIALLGAGMHLSLAAADPEGLTGMALPLASSQEYLADSSALQEMGLQAYLSSYVARQVTDQMPLHARSHPPGSVLFMHGLHRLTGSVRAMALSLLALTALGALLLGRLARELTPQASPCLTAAWWLAIPSVAIFDLTTLDMPRTVAGIAVALACLTAARRGGVGPWLLWGLFYGISSLLTLSLVALWPVMAVLAWNQAQDRRARSVLLAAASAIFGASLIYLALWFYSGFNILACLHAAGQNSLHLMGLIGRPHAMSLVNFPVFAISSGVALSALLMMGIGTRRPGWVRGLLPAVLVGLLATAPFLRGEVERVWLPFTPFLALAGSGLLARLEGRGLARVIGLALVAQAVAVEWIFCTLW